MAAIGEQGQLMRGRRLPLESFFFKLNDEEREYNAELLKDKMIEVHDGKPQQYVRLVDISPVYILGATLKEIKENKDSDERCVSKLRLFNCRDSYEYKQLYKLYTLLLPGYEDNFPVEVQGIDSLKPFNNNNAGGMVKDGHTRLALIRAMIEEEGWEIQGIPSTLTKGRGINEADDLLTQYRKNHGQQGLSMLHVANLFRKWSKVTGSDNQAEFCRGSGAEPVHLSKCLKLASADPRVLSLVRLGRLADTYAVKVMTENPADYVEILLNGAESSNGGKIKPSVINEIKRGKINGSFTPERRAEVVRNISEKVLTLSPDVLLKIEAIIEKEEKRLEGLRQVLSTINDLVEAKAWQNEQFVQKNFKKAYAVMAEKGLWKDNDLVRVIEEIEEELT